MECVDFIKDHFPSKLKAKLSKCSSKYLGEKDVIIYRALKSTCRELREKFLKSTIGLNDSGSSLTAALIIEEELWTANVGNSRIILCQAGHATTLTEDQELEKSVFDEKSKAGWSNLGPRF